MKVILNNKGSILVFSLWIVALLSVFSIQIGLRIRQRATLLTRIEAASDLRHIAAAGVKKALSVLKKDFQRNEQIYTAEGMIARHNNPSKLSSIVLGRGHASVYYKPGEENFNVTKRFGFVDEARKLNVNTAEHIELQRLFEEAAKIPTDEARDIANAILSWREPGDLELEGFYSDHYYEELPFPYETKDMPFEVLDELKLLKGVTSDIYERVVPYLTVYGDGRVNINTASSTVLKALGLPPVLADKVVTVRSGVDGVPLTIDDYLFYRTFDIASEMKGFVDLTDEEVKYLDTLNSRNKLTTNAYYYKILSKAVIDRTGHVLTVICYYNLRENKIEYWREK